MDLLLADSDKKDISAENGDGPAVFANGYVSIGELALELGVTQTAIRFYEREGLISPGRFGRLRAYSRHDKQRLNMIVKLRKMGLSLSDLMIVIKSGKSASLPDQKAQTAKVLKAHLSVLETRLAETQIMINRTSSALLEIATMSPVVGTDRSALGSGPV